MRTAAGFILLCLGAWMASGSDGPKPHKIPIKIVGEGSNFPGQAWGQTYFPPLLSFKVVSGKLPETKGAATLCDVTTVKREHYNTISLHCEEGLVMELEGIDLQGGGQ